MRLTRKPIIKTIILVLFLVLLSFLLEACGTRVRPEARNGVPPVAGPRPMSDPLGFSSESKIVPVPGSEEEVPTAKPLDFGSDPRIALVIGNGAYASSPLNDPPNDAKLIGNTLKALNFNLVGGKAQVNIGKREMKTLIDNFTDRLKKQKDAVGLFYYSGHGVQVMV